MCVILMGIHSLPARLPTTCGFAWRFLWGMHPALGRNTAAPFYLALIGDLGGSAVLSSGRPSHPLTPHAQGGSSEA